MVAEWEAASEDVWRVHRSHLHGPCGQWASLKGMAKLRSARPKKAGAPPVRGGLPCVIFVILAMILVMIFLYLVMSHAG